MEFELQTEQKVNNGSEIFNFTCKDPNRLHLDIWASDIDILMFVKMMMEAEGKQEHRKKPNAGGKPKPFDGMSTVTRSHILLRNSTDVTKPEDKCQAVEIFGNYYFMTSTWTGACTDENNSALRDVGKGLLDQNETASNHNGIEKVLFFEQKLEFVKNVQFPKPSKKTNEDSPKRISVGVIVALVVGYIISIFLTIGITWKLCFSKQQKK
jgi:hypothetical protein